MMTVPKRIFWTYIGTSVVTIATFVTSMTWLASEVDQLAEDEAQLRVATALTNLKQRNALLTSDYAHWTSAFNWFVEGDAGLLYTNIGSGASDSDTFDLVYLMTPQGVPGYVYVSDVSGSDLRNFEPELADQVLADLRTLPIETYRTVTGLVEIDGDFAMLTATRIQPDDMTGLTLVDLPIMIGGQWLSPGMLENSALIEGITFLPVFSDVPDDCSMTYLPGPDGQPVGQIVWPTPTPGFALLVRNTPILGLLIALLAAGSTIVGRISAEQATALFREKEAARTDQVTGLLNRKGIADITSQPNVAAAIRDGKTAVLYVDLNGLKALNDSYGHRIGDEAIRVTAQRLRMAIRKQDYVARMGGDEFACLIIDDDPLGATDLIKKRFQRMSAAQISLEGRTFMAQAATGVAKSDQETNWETMLHDADAAMYADKIATKGRLTSIGLMLPVAG